MVPERAKQSCELSTPSRLLLRSEKAGKKKTFSCSERELPRRDALAIRVRLIIGLSSGPVRLTVPLAQTVFGAPKASRAKRTLRGRGYWPLEVIGSASGQRAEARCPESEDAQKLSVRRKERVKTWRDFFDIFGDIKSLYRGMFTALSKSYSVAPVIQEFS